MELLDPNGPNALCRLYPIDKTANAEGVRRTLAPTDAQQPSEALSSEAASSEPLPPLLRKMLADFAATGLPSPYLPKLSATDEIEEH